MKIRFRGLIVHATRDQGLVTEKQYAALVADNAHKPVLSLLSAYVRRHDPTLPRDTNDDGTISCFPLAGRVLIPALGEGKATFNPNVLPSLLTVTNGTAESAEIDSSTPSSAVFHAVVRLPPNGLLEADDYYLCQASFRGTPFGCLPRTMRFLLNTVGMGIVSFDIGGKFLEVTEDAEMLISNISNTSVAPRLPTRCSAPASSTSHYLHYARFFDPVATVVDAPAQSGSCSFGTPGDALPSCAVPGDLDIDCSNSRFP